MSMHRSASLPVYSVPPRQTAAAPSYPPPSEATATTAPLVLRTARLSLATQAVLTLFTAASLFLPLTEAHRPLLALAALETGAQVIEFAYYAYVLFRLGKIETWTRYLDWVISTPLMLVSTMGFLLYLRDPTLGLMDVFASERLGFALGVLLFNWLMLAFGFAHERGMIQGGGALVAGTLCFIPSFGLLLFGYVRGTGMLGAILFFVLYIVWGLYGIAATQDDVTKNVSYNLLDLVSKNAYGVLLFLYAMYTLREDEPGSGMPLLA